MLSDGAGGGWKVDRKLTAMMVEDFMFDPILAAKVILRIKIPPHQELRMLMMWSRMYTIDDSGFSTGKTFTISIISALRAILFRERIGGVVSKTYAQGKHVFDNFDRWEVNNPIFRSCLTFEKGRPRLVHASEAHIAYFKGGGQVRVLPPGFMTDAERLKSERWNDGYFDEWTSYRNFTAFNKTVIGRVTRINSHPNCPVRQNHIHLTSTPQFMHHPSYSIVKRVQAFIKQKKKDYGRFTCNYRHVPRKPEFDEFVNRKIIFHMQTSLTKGMVLAEIDGLWQSDSASYYSSKIIEPARSRSENTIRLERSSADQVFVGGFDTARGGMKVGGGQGDDCALSIYEVMDRGVGDSKLPVHCLTIRKNGITDTQFAGIIHKWHRKLGFSMLAYDPHGGGMYIRDKLKERTQVIDNVPTDCTPIAEVADVTGTLGDSILMPIRRANIFIAQMWGKMQSDSVLINRIHKEFRDALDTGRVELAPSWDGWTGEESHWDADEKRMWLNRNVALDDVSKIKAEMDLAVSQLMLVDVDRDEDGVAVIDSHGMLKFLSKAKKDSAYSLAYGYLAYLMWQHGISTGFLQTYSKGKSGFIMASMPI